MPGLCHHRISLCTLPTRELTRVVSDHTILQQGCPGLRMTLWLSRIIPRADNLSGQYIYNCEPCGVWVTEAIDDKVSGQSYGRLIPCCLAAALAKAPREKPLRATIRPNGPGEAEEMFRISSSETLSYRSDGATSVSRPFPDLSRRA